MIWMTLDEFESWRKKHDLTGPMLKTAMDMGKDRLRSIRNGSPITKIEALACAHFALVLVPPLVPWDPGSYRDWVRRTYEPGPGALARALDVRSDYITDRMRGYDVQGGRQVPRVPNVALVRATDWIIRFGPACPFGNPIDLTEAQS